MRELSREMPMPREFTVILKQADAEPKAVSRRTFEAINETVRSPLFVFLFGASIATIYPTIKILLTPTSELELQRVQEDARADATLIAPFLANLSASEPGKFQASRAALQALERASRAAAKDKDRPMFAAVNQAIDAVAMQIWPPTEKSVLTTSVVQQIDNSAKAVAPVSDSAETSYARLQSALVYIEVDRDNKGQQELAERVMKTLRANSVVTPGIEKLATSTMPDRTQVRYFHDSDRPRAEDLAAIVWRQTKLDIYIAKPNLDAKEGTLELWFGRK
jgi:hypothetical protein